jgi:hypothetical protein
LIIYVERQRSRSAKRAQVEHRRPQFGIELRLTEGIAVHAGGITPSAAEVVVSANRQIGPDRAAGGVVNNRPAGRNAEIECFREHRVTRGTLCTRRHLKVTTEVLQPQRLAVAIRLCRHRDKRGQTEQENCLHDWKPQGSRVGKTLEKAAPERSNDPW